MTRSYITTPIYYVNAAPHLGHAHTTVMADILKRHRLMRGLDVFLSTGTDEHGQKNQEAAAKSGLSESDYLAAQSAEFQRAFDQLGVAYDFFVRTTRPFHKEQVQRIETLLQDRGLLIRKPYRGLYCAGCEQFKKDSDLTEDGYCLEHPNLKAEATDENNYFLVIEPYRARLIAHIEAHPDWVQPAQYRHELLAMLAHPLEDLCISRPKSRVALGVELPFDPDFVTYVWFDALINYITNIGWPDPAFAEWWAVSEHLIGKDILKTHGVFWPIILMAIDLPLPGRLSVHGHWLGAGGQKMSKSLGNVVDPFEVMAVYGASALRYYLARNMRVASDSQISVDLIKAAYNTELANKLGNLLQRLIKFSAARFDGRLPSPGALDPADAAAVAVALDKVRAAHAHLDLATIPQALALIVEAADFLNEYVTREAPWTLIKTEGALPRVHGIVYAGLDGLRLLLEGLWPVMPVVANQGLAMLGVPEITLDAGAHDFVAGRLPQGHEIGEIATLFPRVET